MGSLFFAEKGSANNTFEIERSDNIRGVIALAGNPNVGKSTIFNRLTGLNQHTGNWPGKTVGSARGVFKHGIEEYLLIDLPGTYSLAASSQEEEIARDFLLYAGADACIVVCDATCLERNLNLVLQTAEITKNMLLCLNLTDEAEKKGIHINIKILEERLGIPVAATNARSGDGIKALIEKVSGLFGGKIESEPRGVQYPPALNAAIEKLASVLDPVLIGEPDCRWLALRLLEGEKAITDRVCARLEKNASAAIMSARGLAYDELNAAGISPQRLREIITGTIVKASEEICRAAVSRTSCTERIIDRKLDKLLTGKLTGVPVMLLLLGGILWLTICGANYPSALLSTGLFWVEARISGFFLMLNAPDWLHGALVLGIYRVLAWVVAVMFPPMAVFFPLFTLLEDFGYLPRVAFNLDHQFKKACTCGKQALTMCMGFGCNAVGVTGCRIIDSPRERLIAIITNSFVPCNGRFPTLLAIITMFFIGVSTGFINSLLLALILTAVIVFGIVQTFLVSRFLSVTVLKGQASSFALELPPYRTPQIGRVIIRSILDRTLFVLGRAVIIAAPAGLIIWILANVSAGGMSLLAHCTGMLDPFGKLLGMDGVILFAFILGFPANEIVVPIIIMSYMSGSSLIELSSLTELSALLTANGWTWVTAVCVMLFCLTHWPCSTTCLTIYKETGSIKWTVLSIALPTIIGMTSCFIFAAAVRLFEFFPLFN